MTQICSYEAVILRSFDVGEADRFLILLTREFGKIAARARGVRRTGSRMGGHLLPFQHLSLLLREGRAGFTVEAAARKCPATPITLRQFAMIEQGAELLCVLLHDGEPLPEVFDLTLAFFEASKCSGETFLPFSLSLLRHLGLLPETANTAFFGTLTEEESSFVTCCASGNFAAKSPSEPFRKRLLGIADRLTAEQTSHALRSGIVAAALHA
ncbi:MAG: recombination protein O N-terminal domain-containing protein [Candidatus Peregrinibacteria bacterium]